MKPSPSSGSQHSLSKFSTSSRSSFEDENAPLTDVTPKFQSRAVVGGSVLHIVVVWAAGSYGFVVEEVWRIVPVLPRVHLPDAFANFYLCYDSALHIRSRKAEQGSVKFRSK